MERAQYQRVKPQWGYGAINSIKCELNCCYQFIGFIYCTPNTDTLDTSSIYSIKFIIVQIS